MAIFGKKEGGLMDVIRCDEPSYLIWKWRPKGQGADSTNKENAIRWGSPLRVKTGEVAVFVYPQKDGTAQDFIEGPFDETIKTANVPVLASIVGLAFDGGSPFQAEVYFINLAQIIQIKFGIPYFNISDPLYPEFTVPVAVRGAVNFKIDDYKAFIKLRGLRNFDLEAFKSLIQDLISKHIKAIVTNIPHENNILLSQIERKGQEINELVNNNIKPRLKDDFGVLVSELDINAIEIDQESEGWQQYKAATQDITLKTKQDMQRIDMKNAEMQAEGANFAVHQLNQQTKVAEAAAESLGQMGQGASFGMGDGGFNPAGMMAGMAMGGAAGQQMAGMMGGMMQGMQQPNMMPPPPVALYNVAVNGQTTGPFTLEQLKQMAQNGQFDKQSLVWKQGMTDWTAAEKIAELAFVISSVPPPPPAN